jgi:hypothetical protein
MKFVKFEDEKAICFRSLYLQHRLVGLKGFDVLMAVVMKSGVFQIMQLNQQE